MIDVPPKSGKFGTPMPESAYTCFHELLRIVARLPFSEFKAASDRSRCVNSVLHGLASCSNALTSTLQA